MAAQGVARRNLSFAQQVAIDRRWNPYIYGGNWDPFKRAIGTDCSGCVVDMLDAALNGTTMSWSRHNLSTENWRPPSMGGNANPASGPFGTVMITDPSQFPADAAVKLAFHHGPGGGENSHTWCQVDGLHVETHGSSTQFPNGATVVNDGKTLNDDVLDVTTIDSQQVYGANSWWYLPGPIVEDGTLIPTGPSSPQLEAPDTLFPDVSEFQAAVTDAFLSQTYAEIGQNWNYRWISIRSNDGTHVDANFAANYAWCVKQCAAGNLDGFFVYYYWRPGTDAVTTHMNLVNAAGGPHPMMVSMMDVESGDGNGSADVSNQLNTDYATLAGWLANAARVIGYGNTGDLANQWPTQPNGLMLIVAGYGTNPNLPNQIAHQYTDGNGYGGGLPEGVAPFGNCDMNSADGYTPSQLAVALGISGTPVTPTPPPVIVVPPAPLQPLSAAQQQDVYNWAMVSFALLFGDLDKNVGAVTLLPGSPTPTNGDPWPLGLSSDQPISFAAAIAALKGK